MSSKNIIFNYPMITILPVPQTYYSAKRWCSMSSIYIYVHTHTHTHTDIYIYIYIYIYTFFPSWLCGSCGWRMSARSRSQLRDSSVSSHIYIYIYIYKHVSLNNKDTICLYNSFNILSGFLVSVLGFRFELLDEFPNIVPSAFEPFIGHHQGLLPFVRCVCIF